jgi:hypothetical protein
MLVGLIDLDAAERWVGDWQSGIEERAAKARAVSRRLAALTVTAHSADRRVEVMIDASGTVTDLRLDERIHEWPAARTAQEILAVMRAAQAQIRRDATNVLAEVADMDSPAGRADAKAFAPLWPVTAEGGRDALG